MIIIKKSLPVMGVSGFEDSFLQSGTNTVISLWPRFLNQSTQMRIPLQENRSLFP